jgi:hypothetical protein
VKAIILILTFVAAALFLVAAIFAASANADLRRRADVLANAGLCCLALALGLATLSAHVNL